MASKASNWCLIDDESKLDLMERYYDLEFNKDVDTELHCVLCDRVAITNFYSDCNHLFCKICRLVVIKELDGKCPKCEKNVGDITKRVLVAEVKLCGLTLSCPNRIFGCDFISPLVEMTFHNKSCEYKTKKPEEPKPEEKTKKRRANHTCKRTTYTWKIKDFSQYIVERKRMCKAVAVSPPFAVNGLPVMAEAVYDFYYNLIYLRFRNQGESTAVAKFTAPLPKVTYTFYSNIVDESGYYVRISELLLGDLLETDGHPHYSCFVSSRNLMRITDNDALLVKIDLDYPHLSEDPVGRTGLLHWQVDNFSKRIEMQRTGQTISYFSPYFYTGDYGYKVRAQLLFEKHKILSICILAGEFDFQLPPDPRFLVIVAFFHKSEPEVKEFVHTSLVFKRIYKIVLDCVLRRYVHNDSILIEITVKPIFEKQLESDFH